MKATYTSTLSLSRLFVLTICAAALCACSGLSAQTAEGKGAPPKPPAEAMEACKSASSGVDCSFASPQGTVKGTCWAPEGKPLACKPKDAPSRVPGTPKQ